MTETDQKIDIVRDEQQTPRFNWNKILKLIFGWCVILLGFYLLFIWDASNEREEQIHDVSFEQYNGWLDNGNIKEAVVVKLNEALFFHGTLKSPEYIEIKLANVGTKQILVEKFTVKLPYSNIDDAVMKRWTEKDIAITIEEKNTLTGIYLSVLPVIIIIGFFVFFKIKRVRSKNKTG